MHRAGPGFASADGYFGALLERERAAGHAVPQAVAARVEQAATTARAGYAECAARLRDDLLEVAPAADACGRELYELHSRFFLGARIDLAETYAWGVEELARIRDRMRQLARRIAPDALAGADAQDLVRAARERLDADERYRLQGTEALRRGCRSRRTGPGRARAGALRHPGAVAPHRVSGGAHPDGRDLLHGTE